MTIERRRARRDLAVAMLLSAAIHSIVGGLIVSKRLTDTFAHESRETEVVNSRPSSISFEPFKFEPFKFEPFKRIVPPPAKHVTNSEPSKPLHLVHSNVARPRQVAPQRAPRSPAVPAAVPPAAAVPAAALPAASAAQSTASSAEAAVKATARMQRMLDDIAASAAPVTPLRATPDAVAIALEARSGYDALIDPPEGIVSRAIGIISFKRTAGSPDSVVYILRRRKLLGISFCTGWSIVAHPLGGGPPQTGYFTGPCRGDAAALPGWADRLPRLPAHEAPPATPSPQSS